MPRHGHGRKRQDVIKTLASNSPENHWSIAYALFTYLAFIIYGSLVPLDYHDHALDVAWQAFLNIPYLNLDTASRADWVANILLYIPLAFLGSMLLIRRHFPMAVNLASAAVIYALCALTAVSIEFTQFFFPPRTVSLNDIFAELIGSGLGIMAWFLWGAQLSSLLAELGRGGKKAIRAIVILYVAGYLALSLFPYDFIDSLAELSEKTASGNFGFLLVNTACDSVFRCMVKLVAETAAVIPLGLLLTVESTRRHHGRLLRPLLIGMMLGLVIEGLQFLLVSGITQGLSVLTRSLGMAAGVALFPHIKRMGMPMLRRWIGPAALFSAPIYLIFLAALNRWFSGTWSGVEYASQQLSELHFLPFYYHYYTSEQNALFSLLTYSIMYMPLGFGYWALTVSWPGIKLRGSSWIVAFLGGSIALVMESGKLFIHGQHPDPTDVWIGAAAATSAYALAKLFNRWLTDKGGAVLDHPISPAGQKQSPETKQSHPFLGMRILALLAALSIGGLLLNYPLGRSWLALALIVYAGFLWRFPSLWLVAVPALLPVLDLAPWTGWFYLDEFDLLLLVTFGIALWKSAPSDYSRTYPKMAITLVAMLALSYAISLSVGLFPLQPLDANAFSSYYSHYNALRVAKGFIWAIVLWLLLRRSIKDGHNVAAKFTLGTLLGLTGLVMAVLWERAVFSGLANFTDDFRITGTFATMHTGGGHLEAYLAMALPFAAMWAIQGRGILPKVAGTLLFSLGVYAILVTFSRGGYLALAVSMIVLVAGILLRIRSNVSGRNVKAITTILVLGAAMATAVPILEGSYIQNRFKRTGEDLNIRSAHWQNALKMMSSGWSTSLFGMGLGRYPETFYWNNLEGVRPASARYGTEKGNTYLLLSAGSPLNFEQIVNVTPGQTYVLSLDARSKSPQAALNVPVCAKSLLYSFHCVPLNIRLNSSANHWTTHRISFNSDNLGGGAWISRQPVKLTLNNVQEGTIVDVDNIKLTDRFGNNLIFNGDFSKGNANWYFSTDNHLPWHIKNLWVAILFEQGWFGFVSFGFLLAYAIYKLAGRAVRGDPIATTSLSAISGFLVVGLFDSPFDAPRLTLFFLMIILSAIGTAFPVARRNTKN